jgi:hypothetical protein
VSNIDQNAALGGISTLSQSNTTPLLEIVRFTRPKPLDLMTKVISLNPDGSLKADGSLCKLWEGYAERVYLAGVTGGELARALAEAIKETHQDQAISLGRLRADLLPPVAIVTKANLANAPADSIARTGQFLEYARGIPAFASVDVDTKGMPVEMRQRIDAAGGFWQVLNNIVTELGTSARVERASTSSWIYRTDTNPSRWVTENSGAHYYVLVADGGDIPRFLKDFAARCWLHGFGWMILGRSGQILTRSLVDPAVGGAQGIMFEGPPYLHFPLVQDTPRREPKAFDGGLMDSARACQPLSVVEKSKLKELQTKERHRWQPEAQAAQAIADKVKGLKIAQQQGRSVATAADLRAAARAREGNLLSGFVLQFDDPALASMTVGDVLADPQRFADETLADPLEGVEYGVCKAKVMLGSDGKPWIHSFAHGRTIYHLFLDAEAASAAIKSSSRDKVVSLFGKLAIDADLTPEEHQSLREQAKNTFSVGVRELDRGAKAAQEARDAAWEKEEQDRRAAERQDPRPQIVAPLPDAPFLPVMETLNDVLGASDALEPPMRDIEGHLAQVRVRRVPNMHALTAEGINDGDAEKTRLPPPEMPLLSRLRKEQAGELIEHHIDYTDPNGWRSVHLHPAFVEHFREREDGKLPTVAAITTLPVMLADGTLLAKRGLDRKRGIVFRVPDEFMHLVPRQEDCTPLAVARAMRFLTDEFLVDVATDYVGKCILISAVMTIVLRMTLPKRPVFFVTAGKRGGGKTTALNMVLRAATGVEPAAAAWSNNEEERRKALFAYLMQGVPAIVWDNIVKGTQVDCPHINAACTAEFYSDRVLGVSAFKSVAASTIQLFTGNNIGPRGDLASRSLQVRIDVDRPDPENRPFKHPDPIGWTTDNRGRILQALYTIMLGNPAIPPGSKAVPKTRFPEWWRVIGSAVEHAAFQHIDHVFHGVVGVNEECSPDPIDFRDVFLTQEESEEESASLGEALVALSALWPEGARFTAAELAVKIATTIHNDLNAASRSHVETLRDFLFADWSRDKPITAKATSKRLRGNLGNPVKAKVEDERGVLVAKIFCLMRMVNSHSKTTDFWVKAT